VGVKMEHGFPSMPAFPRQGEGVYTPVPIEGLFWRICPLGERSMWGMMSPVVKGENTYSPGLIGSPLHPLRPWRTLPVVPAMRIATEGEGGGFP
jgi:hypothetical protein